MNGLIMNANTHHKRTAQIGWAIMWTSVTLVTAGLILSIIALINSQGIVGPAPHQFFNPIVTITFGAAGALISARYPRNPIGWLFLAISFLSGLNLLLLGYSKIDEAGVFAISLPGVTVARWMDRWIWIPPTVLPLTLLLLWFPDGTLPSKRWQPVAWAVNIGLVGICLAIALHPSLEGFGETPNPYSLVGAESILEGIMYVSGGLVAVGMVGSVVRLIMAYRQSKGARREQMKWLVYACGLTVAAIILTGFLPSIIHNESAAQEISIILTGMTTVSMIVATGIAILRHRLYNIDLIINRTLVYGVLTIVLGLMFISSVFILQRGFEAVTGGRQSPVALGVSTLVIGGLFSPSRRSLQRVVDRHLYGIEIDYVSARTMPLKNQLHVSDQPVERVGGYEKLHTIGQGGMAEVYKAHHPALNRTVAVKVMHPAFTSSSEYQQRFEREAQIVAGLKHPNVIQIFDFGQEANRYYMVMEYINGPDLATILNEHSPLSLSRTRVLIQEIADALDYAHEQGLVHRDIKPSNIMIEPVTSSDQHERHERAVLMDFGIAKDTADKAQLTMNGSLMGTLDYMAPEQITASSDVDRRADVYSLGVMLYQMVTGELPFKGSHPGAVIMGHLKQTPRDPRELRPDLPDVLAEAILQSLAKNPRERLSTAGQLAACLSVIDVPALQVA